MTLERRRYSRRRQEGGAAAKEQERVGQQKQMKTVCRVRIFSHITENRGFTLTDPEVIVNKDKTKTVFI